MNVAYILRIYSISKPSYWESRLQALGFPLLRWEGEEKPVGPFSFSRDSTLWACRCSFPPPKRVPLRKRHPQVRAFHAQESKPQNWFLISAPHSLVDTDSLCRGTPCLAVPRGPSGCGSLETDKVMEMTLGIKREPCLAAPKGVSRTQAPPACSLCALTPAGPAGRGTHLSFHGKWTSKPTYNHLHMWKPLCQVSFLSFSTISMCALYLKQCIHKTIWFHQLFALEIKHKLSCRPMGNSEMWQNLLYKQPK